MSARREARARGTHVQQVDTGEPPVALLIGPCIDVWAPGDRAGVIHGWRAWQQARSRWLEDHGLTHVMDGPPELYDRGPWRLSAPHGADKLARKAPGWVVGDLIAQAAELTRESRDWLPAREAATDRELEGE